MKPIVRTLTRLRRGGASAPRAGRLAASALVLAALAAAAPSEAQRKRGRQTAAPRAAPKPDPIRSLVGAISINTLREGGDLFAACEASDFKTLAWGLEGVRSRISLVKGEYETQAEFAARRSGLEAAIGGPGEVVVCQPLDDNEDAPFSYDADKEAFEGSFAKRQNVWRDVKRTGRYVSRTRMGVRAAVTSSVQIDYDVDFGTALEPRPACVAGNYLYTYRAPVPRQAAPSLKAQGYLAFVGRLAAPFIESTDVAGKPTLDDPRDVFRRDLTVHFRPRSASVVGPGGKRYWECVFAGQ